MNFLLYLITSMSVMQLIHSRRGKVKELSMNMSLLNNNAKILKASQNLIKCELDVISVQLMKGSFTTIL